MNFSQWAIAQLQREQAEHEARDRVGRLAPAEARNGNSVSTVFTVRLDRREHVQQL